MNTPDDNRTATPSPPAGGGAGEPAMLDTVERLDAALTEGAYSVRETLWLTGVSDPSIRRWLSGDFTQQGLSLALRRKDAEGGIPPVSFLEMIEILIAGKIRSSTGESFRKVREYHDEIAAAWETRFPFAHQDMADVVHEKGRFLWKVAETLEQMEYEADLVTRWYPLGKDQHITVDPRRGSGFPVIEGRRVRVEDIVGQFKSGAKLHWIAEDFDIEPSDVESALRFALRTAQ